MRGFGPEKVRTAPNARVFYIKHFFQHKINNFLIIFKASKLGFHKMFLCKFVFIEYIVLLEKIYPTSEVVVLLVVARIAFWLPISHALE